jgi:hypothetical protein
LETIYARQKITEDSRSQLKGSHSGSLRIGRIPIVGFEVRNKLLHLWYPDILTILQAKSRNSRLKHESGEDQPVTPEIYAQMFATAFNQRQMGVQSATLDQHAFQVYFQGTTIAIMSADYSDEYIQDIKNTGGGLRGRQWSEHQTRRTKGYAMQNDLIKVYPKGKPLPYCSYSPNLQFPEIAIAILDIRSPHQVSQVGRS